MRAIGDWNIAKNSTNGCPSTSAPRRQSSRGGSSRKCGKYGCPSEIILKDISIIRYQRERLDAWAKVAMDLAGG
jgi:hypothetical protein